MSLTVEWGMVTSKIWFMDDNNISEMNRVCYLYNEDITKY